MVGYLSRRHIKKFISTSFVLALTTGASLIIGILSFGGFFSLWHIASVAVGALILSVAYEGEIYFQNIKLALDKLFQPNHIKLDLARIYLHKFFPYTLSREQWPRFFIQYEFALHRLYQLNHPLFDPKISYKKRLIEKKLNKMERYFSEQLGMAYNQTDSVLSKDKESLLLYLMLYPSSVDHDVPMVESIPQKYHNDLQVRKRIFFWVRLFSLSMVFVMGIGTTCLLGATLPDIPVFSTGSFSNRVMFLLPLTAISGLAYGLLIYNTITNIITHDTLRSWYTKLNREFRLQGLTIRNLILLGSTIILAVLSIVLTCFTAGAWWTFIRRSKPVFFWMTKIPKWVFGGILTSMISLSSLIFNIENTSESLEMLSEISRDKKSSIKQAMLLFRNELRALSMRENVAQLLNPFRIVLAISITPLRILFFFGHVLSIGVTTPRSPGAPKMWQALFGIISKGFVDAHYFMGNNPYIKPDTTLLLSKRLGYHPRRRNEIDLPTRILMHAVFPLYFLAAVWDYAFSRFNIPERRLRFAQAFQKQWVLHKLHRKTDYALIGKYLNMSQSR